MSHMVIPVLHWHTNERKYFPAQGSTSPDQLSKLQKQVKQAREVIEQLESDRELAIAEVKQQVHEEIQAKDEEVVKAREQVQIKDRDLVQARQQVEQFQHENQAFQEKIDRLEKAGKSKQSFFSPSQLFKRKIGSPPPPPYLCPFFLKNLF